MALRPLILCLFDFGLEEMICGFRGGGSQLIGTATLGDLAQVGVDVADGAGFLPGFAAGGLLDGLVGFPTAFG